MQEIIIEPCRLWGYIQEQDKHSELDGVMCEIAKNEEYGIAVYITRDGKNDRYSILVEADDMEIFSDYIYDKEDAEETCNMVYDNYLTDKVFELFFESEDDTTLSQEDKIELREEELDESVTSFIMDVLGGDTYFDSVDFDDIVKDCKEHFLEYMARKHGFEIYRPMILEDENGEDFFEEYPYECMEFDDEDNPIYQP